MSFFIENLTSHDNEVLFWPDPVRSIFYQMKSHNQIRIQNPQPSANHWLRVFENKLNSDWFFVVVLILVDS